MRDRIYTRKHGFVNLHQTRGTQSKTYGNESKQKKFSKKVTGKMFKVDKLP